MVNVDDCLFNETTVEQVALISRLVVESMDCDDRDRQVAIALIAGLTMKVRGSKASSEAK